jgi:D-alanyl-D-alanine carboxypeptidase/D-alanyl-D-alanine-endopeptidase (penicillin-binding protein 4)
MNAATNRSLLGSLAALAITLGLTIPAPAGDDLAAKIDEIVSASAYEHSRWGILVVHAASGQTVYARNPDMLCVPASVTKLYSCAAALAAFGPDYRFTTPVHRRGEVANGSLAGDLILVASGDPTLGGRSDGKGGLAFKDHDHTYANWLSAGAELTEADPLSGLAALARQVREAGIRRVEGDVLVDDRLFARARATGSGPEWLSPIVVNDNCLDVTVSPAAAAGQPAALSVRPATDYVQVDGFVETAERGSGVRVTAERVAPLRFTVRGKVPAGGKTVLRICPVEDPAGFARALFIGCLRRAGVEVAASAFRPPTAELPERESCARLPRVAAFTSPPMAELLKVTLKVSHNLYASTLPLLLAAREGKQTVADGMRCEGRILKDLGVDVSSISLESGAGGGNADRVTPAATVRLLRAMTRRPDFAVYEAALPVLGVDGTLADAVGPDCQARGRARAKTGTYGDGDLLNARMLLRSKALAGYLTAANGRALVFAVFLNDVPLPRGTTPDREGKALGRLCETLYRHAP